MRVKVLFLTPFQLPFCFVAQNEAPLIHAAVHFVVHYLMIKKSSTHEHVDIFCGERDLVNHVSLIL
jgi:hypothetical protein